MSSYERILECEYSIDVLNKLIIEIQNRFDIQNEVMSLRDKVLKLHDLIKNDNSHVLEGKMKKYIEEQEILHTLLENILRRISKYIYFKEYYYNLVNMWIQEENFYDEKKFINKKLEKLRNRLIYFINNLKHEHSNCVDNHIRSIMIYSKKIKR